MIRTALCLLAIPLLAACGDDPAPVVTDDQSRTAEGDVLGGSISDEMIPLDKLQSTSPAARETASAAGNASTRPEPRPDAAPTEEAPEPAAPAEPVAAAAPETSAEPEAE